MAENCECGLKIFQSTPSKLRRVDEFGTSVARISDLHEWSDLYEKQDQLEKLRLYYTYIAWQIVTKVYPKHKMITKYNEILASPDFIKQKLKSVSSDIDEISDSLALLGTIPQYHMLSNEQCPRIPKVTLKPFPKSEPLEE